MKIAFLHRDLPPDSQTGVATQVHRLAKGLHKLGHDITVFTTSRPQMDTGYRVMPALSPGQAASPLLSTPLKRIVFPYWFKALDFSGYDVVHIHGDGGFLDYQPHYLRTFYGSAYYERYASQTLKGKAAQTISWWFEKKERRLCRHQSAISKHLANVFPTLERIIPCMLEADVALAVPDKSRIPTMIHVGSLFGRKQGRLALQLISALKSKGRHWKLHLVCPPEEAKRISRSGLDGEIKIHSRLSAQDLHSLYAESWVNVSLSKYEGFGLSLIEAMSQGCPVLSIPHAGAIDLFESAWPESLCPFSEMPERLHALEKRYGKGDWPRDRCLELARNYQPGKVVGQYVEWYHDVMKAVPP
jgi:phosphatidyl-myo-inositol alpha-mannosyltransferase